MVWIRWNDVYVLLGEIQESCCSAKIKEFLSYVRMDAKTPNIFCPTMLGVVSSVCRKPKVWPVSNFARQLQITRNNMQQGVQTDTTCWELLANNVASVCMALCMHCSLVLLEGTWLQLFLWVVNLCLFSVVCLFIANDFSPRQIVRLGQKCIIFRLYYIINLFSKG